MFFLKNLVIGWVINRILGGNRRGYGRFNYGRSSGGLLAQLLGGVIGGGRRRRFG